MDLRGALRSTLEALCELDSDTYGDLAVYEEEEESTVTVFNESTGAYTAAYPGQITELVARGYLSRHDNLIRLTSKGREQNDLEKESRARNIDPGADDEVDRRKVMVVCGRNQPAIDDLFSFLQAIDLRPAGWSKLVQDTGSAAPYIGEVLERAFATAQAVVVLATPDDVAALRPVYCGDAEPSHETDLTPQARPNVLFEAGLAFGSHPNRTILVELGALRPVSDLSGRHAIRLTGTSGPLREIARRLETAGCTVDLDSDAWLQPERYPGLDPSSLPDGIQTPRRRGASGNTTPSSDASLQRSGASPDGTEAARPVGDNKPATATAPGGAERLRKLLDEGRQLCRHASAGALASTAGLRVSQADADVWAKRVRRLLRGIDPDLVAEFDHVPFSERFATRLGVEFEVEPRFKRRLERQVANLGGIVADFSHHPRQAEA